MNRPKSKLSTIFLILIIIVVLTFFLKLLGLYGPFQSFSSAMTEPVFSRFYSVGRSISGVFHRSSDLTELTAENESLREEVLNLKQSLAQLESAKQENASLRQLLNFFSTETNDLSRAITRVIGRDPENSQILLLSIGRREGIEIGNAVIVDDGVMVAKIIEVFARTSKALLLTDSQSSTAVTISGGAPTSKLARGERGLSISLDQVPQGEILTSGQLVITSGLEPNIPRGLLIGEIEEVISETNDLFQKAILRPVLDYESVYFASVILTPSE